MKKIVYTIGMLLFFVGSVNAGGPWPQAKGIGFFKVSEWWIVFDKHFTDTGLTDPNITTGIFNTFVYGEYGITNRLTGIVSAPLFSRNYMNNLVSETTQEVLVKGDAVNSIGDVDLGIKYGLTKPGSKIPVSASLILGLPTGKAVAGELNNLQTGDGEFNQMLQLDAGMGFSLGKHVSSYASVYTAYNNRTKDFSDEFRFGAEYGLGLFKQRLWLTARLNVVESLRNGSKREEVTSTSIFANNTEYTSIGFEASFYVTRKIGISAGMAGASRGELIAAAPSYSIGVFYDMSK